MEHSRNSLSCSGVFGRGDEASNGYENTRNGTRNTSEEKTSSAERQCFAKLVCSWSINSESYTRLLFSGHGLGATTIFLRHITKQFLAVGVLKVTGYEVYTRV
jgi:hypothetical protein